MKNKTRLISDELVFSIAFFITAILKPLTVIVAHSTLLLSLSYLLLYCIVLFRNSFRLNFSGKKSGLVIIVLICVGFTFDILVRNNSMTASLFYDFFRCGIIPFFFFLYVKDYNKLLFTWAVIAMFVGLMYCIEPLNGYHLTGNYMQFGYGEMLPALMGTLILIYFFEKKWAICVLVFFFAELCLFANKGAILTAFVSLIVVASLASGKINFKIYCFVGAVVLLLVAFSKDILGFFYDIARMLDFNSYSLNTISMMINGKSESIFNLRFDIWKDVMELLTGHWFNGRGNGYYMSIRQTYPHNVILDILLHGGLLCAVPACIGFVKSLFKIKRVLNTDKRNYIICMLLLWFIPMNMSLTLWQYTPFWMYFFVVFSRNEHPEVIS